MTPISNRRWPLVAANVVLVVHGAAVLRLGVSLPPDAATFSRWADLLIASRFNFVAVVHSAAARNLPAGMYMLFTTVVALAKLVAGAKWIVVLVAANLIFDALTAAILVRLVVLATRSTAAVLLTIAAWLVCFDLVIWIRMPLTDVPFLCASFAAFASLVAPALAGQSLTKRSIAVVALLSVIASVLRPVGFLWAILFVVVWSVVSGRVSRRRAIAATVLAGALIFAGHTLLVRNPERWPFETLARSVRWDARSYQHGDVVLSRPETSHRPPSTMMEYAAISADRFVHFFAFASASFSRLHKIAGAAFYVPLYLLALAALAAAARRRGVRENVTILSAVVELAVAFWHCLVVIDYDWRYRLPVLPHLIFLAACAVRYEKYVEASARGRAK